MLDAKNFFSLLEPFEKLVEGGFSRFFCLAKGGVQSKLRTVCENEHGLRRRIAEKTPQIILQVAPWDDFFLSSRADGLDALTTAHKAEVEKFNEYSRMLLKEDFALKFGILNRAFSF